MYSSTDLTFVGGLVGFPGKERIVLPSAWQGDLQAEVVTMQIKRRKVGIFQLTMTGPGHWTRSGLESVRICAGDCPFFLDDS